MKKKIFLSALLVLMVNYNLYAETGKELQANLKALMDENFRATQEEDVTAVLDTIHSLSPSYISSQKTCEALFPVYDLQYEILDFELIGISGDYAIARLKQKTIKVDGPLFQDNIIDLMCSFRKDGQGRWKFWTQAILDVKYI